MNEKRVQVKIGRANGTQWRLDIRIGLPGRYQYRYEFKNSREDAERRVEAIAARHSDVKIIWL